MEAWAHTLPRKKRNRCDGDTVSGEYEVVVRLSFPVSAEKARVVLERWKVEKERRKVAMRAYRAGKMKRVVPA